MRTRSPVTRELGGAGLLFVVHHRSPAARFAEPAASRHDHRSEVPPGKAKEPIASLAAPKWLELAAEFRGLADAALSPEVRSVLHELAFSYTAFAAGLDASGDRPCSMKTAHPTGLLTRPVRTLVGGQNRTTITLRQSD